VGGGVGGLRSDNQAEDATNNGSTIKSVNILTKHNLCCANFCIWWKVSGRKGMLTRIGGVGYSALWQSAKGNGLSLCPCPQNTHHNKLQHML